MCCSVLVVSHGRERARERARARERERAARESVRARECAVDARGERVYEKKIWEREWRCADCWGLSTHCNAPRHTEHPATHCNALQHRARGSWGEDWLLRVFSKEKIQSFLKRTLSRESMVSCSVPQKSQSNNTVQHVGPKDTGDFWDIWYRLEKTRAIGCLIFQSHFPQTSPMKSGRKDSWYQHYSILVTSAFPEGRRQPVAFFPTSAHHIWKKVVSILVERSTNQTT